MAALQYSHDTGGNASASAGSDDDDGSASPGAPQQQPGRQAEDDDEGGGGGGGGELVIVTADAMHTQEEHVKAMNALGVAWMLILKDNQPDLYAAADAHPWENEPVLHGASQTGHGHPRAGNDLPAFADGRPVKALRAGALLMLTRAKAAAVSL